MSLTEGCLDIPETECVPCRIVSRRWVNHYHRRTRRLEDFHLAKRRERLLLPRTLSLLLPPARVGCNTRWGEALAKILETRKHELP